MPLDSFCIQPPDIYVGRWKISESIDQLEQAVLLSGPEKEQYLSFKNEMRRKQWLAVRMLLRQMLSGMDTELTYNEHGKPSFRYLSLQVSVSHSGDYTAVIVSKEKNVGIDVERIREKILNITERFLSVQELSFIQPGDIDSLYACWGAKEAVYKLYGSVHVDFRENIRIHPFHFQNIGNFTAEISIDSHISSFEIKYEKKDGYMLVYTYSN